MSSPADEITTKQTDDEPQLRDLFSFCAGGRSFAVFAEEVESTAESKRPTLLPHAPGAVLGVVCVRGRMITVLDPLALVAGELGTWPTELPYVIALRGDEQLALAADNSGDTITVLETDLEQTEDATGINVIAGTARFGGVEITVLETKNLFTAAVRRKERRRRRF